MMQLRFRIFMGARGLLYLGPLLAGLGGAGWRAVLAFAAVFILWLVVMRPRQWPRSLVDWRSAPAITQALTQALMQLVLVTLLFALGRAIGGALGLRPAWPGFLPLALSFLAIPLGRLVWDPWKADEVNGFNDAALVAGAGAGEATAMAMLDAMPRGLSADQVAEHLRAMAAGPGPEALWQALQRASDADRLRALVVFATDAHWIKVLDGGIPAKAWDLLPEDPDLLAMFAGRSLDALEQDRGLWGHFPNRQTLAARLQAMAGTTADAPLRGLLDAYDRIDPPTA
jgi:hypothetical protein